MRLGRKTGLIKPLGDRFSGIQGSRMKDKGVWTPYVMGLPEISFEKTWVGGPKVQLRPWSATQELACYCRSNREPSKDCERDGL